MSGRTVETEGGRGAAARAVAGFIRALPDAHPKEPTTAGLSGADARFAVALYRETVRRWLTIAWIVRRHVKRGTEKLEPGVYAALAVGVTQLLFMEGIPAHAVINEGVKWVKRSSKAAGLVNAVLHKVADLVGEQKPGEVYKPDVRSLPGNGGGVIRLKEPILPPIKTIEDYLSIATSHPRGLVGRWIRTHGVERTMEMLLHDLREPPVIMFFPSVAAPENTRPHLQLGFHVWEGAAGQLGEVLKRCGGWVQDPTAHRAVASTSGLRPGTIVDYCAGRGTKTLQLRTLHPGSKVFASDPNPQRFDELVRRFAGDAVVTILPHEELSRVEADLLVLDVPCGNSGVFARRVEARYRDSDVTLASLVALQREIMDRALPCLSPGGRLLYSTCSIERSENEEQVAYAVERFGLRIEKEEAVLPGGEGVTYHDGGYHALLSRAGA